MVATKLAEMTSKGIEAVSSSSTTSAMSQLNSNQLLGDGKTGIGVHDEISDHRGEALTSRTSTASGKLSSVVSGTRSRSQSTDATLDTEKDVSPSSVRASSVPASPLRSVIEDTIASASSFASATLAATLSREDNNDIDDYGLNSKAASMKGTSAIQGDTSIVKDMPSSFKDKSAFPTRSDLPPRGPSLTIPTSKESSALPTKKISTYDNNIDNSMNSGSETMTNPSTDSSLNKSSWWSTAENAGSTMSSSSRYIADSLNDAVESAWSYIPSPSSFVDLSMPSLMGGAFVTKETETATASARGSDEIQQSNSTSMTPKQRSRRSVLSHNLPSLFKNPYATHTHEPTHQMDTLASVRNMLSYIPPEPSADEDKGATSILSPFLQHHRRSFLSPLSSIDSDEERSTCSSTSFDKESDHDLDFDEPTKETEYGEKLNKRMQSRIGPHRAKSTNKLKRVSTAQQRRRRYLENDGSSTMNGAPNNINSANSDSVSHHRSEAAQTASRLAEGTVRALRDIALDEAVELNEALQFWTERWEHPALAWLEAGPIVWFSKEGYKHQKIGQKVSQIQAVLARRCASIGELQQHLWRAGWQQGVAQWGVIGEGTGKWATVVGGDGALENEYPNSAPSTSKNDTLKDNDYNDKGVGTHDKRGTSGDENCLSLHENDEVTSSDRNNSRKEPVELLPHAPEIGFGSNTSLSYLDYNVTNNQLNHRTLTEYSSPSRTSSYYKVGNNFVTVARSRGGEIVSHDPAFVIWTVDALRMVRDQVYRAGDGLHPLPYYENWPQERDHFGASNSGTNDPKSGNNNVRSDTERSGDFDYLPLWATYDLNDEKYVDARQDEEEQMKSDESSRREDNADCESGPEGGSEKPIFISNLPLMASEVSELLDSMELLMQQQRDRRGTSATLRPMTRWRRNWYVGTILVPAATYTLYQSIKTAKGVEMTRRLWHNIREFYAEHVADPVAYVYQQLFESRSREDVADKAARKQAIDSLKIMLKDWLQQRFPSMSAQDRERIVNNMDLTLLEKRKEESVKTALWEINDIVHMSLIEMQFIKKELFNAMVSMDELMQSNEFNFKLAAMTPAIVVVYGVNKMFRFLFYALLKLGKSREQIHEQLRLAVIDMERLLVMRDSPPSTAPPPLDWKSAKSSKFNSNASAAQHSARVAPSVRYETSAPVVLSSDDLGMLMLLIHECRSIMLKNRRRFSQQEFRSMAEDLAELSGERGPVSVKQQLLIISRMFRTYSFLKVVSSGVSINISRYMEKADLPF